MKSERIYVGNKPAPAYELLKWCSDNGITIQFHPAYKDKPFTAHINLHTTKREQKYLPMLKAIGWKHYHYPPSNSVYKSVGFEHITI